MTLGRREFLISVLGGVATLSVSSCLAAMGGRSQRAYASPANGGRSQVNFGHSGDFAFINHLKTAQTWYNNDNSGMYSPTLLDEATGYPHTISNGGPSTIFFIPNATYRPGNWVAKCVGTCSAAFGMANTSVSGSMTGTNWRHVFTPGDTRVVFNISAVTGNITNLAIMHEDDEAAYDAGEIFTQKFKDTLAEAGFGVYRFLNWQGSANVTNIAYWKHRKPVTYWSWRAHEQRPSAYGGTTTNSGDDYSVSAPSDWNGLEDKALVIVKFNADASGTGVTLNVGGTGAKAVKYATGGDLNASFSIPKTGIFATLIYDEDLDCWIKHGGDLAGTNAFLKNGVPLEIMLALCAEMGAHPWFCQPYLSADPITDYMPSLVQATKDFTDNNNLDWMIPRFEGVNELWNPGADFWGTPYALLKSTLHWGSQDQYNWMGKTMSLLGQAVSDVYDDDRTKYQVICGVQTAGSGDVPGVSTPRLTSAKYVSENGGLPAKDWITHVAIANYFSPRGYNTALESAAATLYVAASTDEKAQIANQWADNTFRPIGSPIDPLVGGLASVNWYTVFPRWVTWATTHGLKVCCYEGGFSPDYISGQDNQNDLRYGIKMSPNIYYAEARNYAFIDSLGIEFPSCYSLSGGGFGNGGAWPVFEGRDVQGVDTLGAHAAIYQTPSPRWQAIIDFNHSAQGRLR